MGGNGRFNQLPRDLGNHGEADFRDSRGPPSLGEVGIDTATPKEVNAGILRGECFI